MEFEWDDAKAGLNLGKHGIGFDQAKIAFADESWIEIIDEREDCGELRFILIGMAQEHILLVVVFTEREDRIRIISARQANLNEQKQYFRQFH